MLIQFYCTIDNHQPVSLREKGRKENNTGHSTLMNKYSAVRPQTHFYLQYPSESEPRPKQPDRPEHKLISF